MCFVCIIFTCENEERDIPDTSEVWKARIICADSRWQVHRKNTLSCFVPLAKRHVCWSMLTETYRKEFKECGTESIGFDEETEIVPPSPAGHPGQGVAGLGRRGRGDSHQPPQAPASDGIAENT